MRNENLKHKKDKTIQVTNERENHKKENSHEEQK